MPRGQVGGATAALIAALAERGVRASPYQIERWRASGELARPVRHGRGRGRGVVSEPPDESTVQAAMMLATASRRGSRRYGVHPVERFAAGLPVPDDVIRGAIDDVLADMARLVAADVTDADAGWQARHDLVARVPYAQAVPFSWQELLDAVDGPPVNADLPRPRVRSALAGVVHVLGGGSEVLSEDLIEYLGIFGHLPDDQLEQLRHARQEAELRGDDVWDRIAEDISIHRLRQLAVATDLDRWQRALSVVAIVSAYQTWVALAGMLALAGQQFDFGDHVRIDTAVVRKLQADPMWAVACRYRLNLKPKQRVRGLVLLAMGLLLPGHVEAMEAYQGRLVAAIHPQSASVGNT